MAIVLDGTSGATLPVPLAVAQGGTGSTTLTLTSPVIAGTPTGVGVLTSATAQASTSGTSIDFTGIPSWAKRVTVMLNACTGTGTSVHLIQLGSGSVQTTGYNADSVFTGLGGASSVYYTTGFGVNNNTNRWPFTGSIQFTLIGSNLWVGSGSFCAGSVNVTAISAGGVTLAGALDRVRVTFLNGTDTFTAGSINILYE